MRKSCKRVVRPVDANALDRALTAQQLLSATQVLDITLHARIAFQAMRNGQACEENWVTVACAMNMACVFCEIGIGLGYHNDMQAALDACRRVKLRAARTGSWSFDGDGMQAVALALELHDEQISIATCKEIRFAIDSTHKQALANEMYKNVEYLIDDTVAVGE